MGAAARLSLRAPSALGRAEPSGAGGLGGGASEIDGGASGVADATCVSPVRQRLRAGRHDAAADPAARGGTGLAQHRRMRAFTLAFFLSLSFLTACVVEDDAELPDPSDEVPELSSVEQKVDLGWYYVHAVGPQMGRSDSQHGVWFEVFNRYQNGRGITYAYATIGSDTPPVLITGILLMACEDGTSSSYVWQEVLSSHNPDTSPDLSSHYPTCAPEVRVAESALLINFQR
jgi:hypothetical protein